jgi:hypothetical protein
VNRPCTRADSSINQLLRIVRSHRDPQAAVAAALVRAYGGKRAAAQAPAGGAAGPASKRPAVGEPGAGSPVKAFSAAAAAAPAVSSAASVPLSGNQASVSFTADSGDAASAARAGPDDVSAGFDAKGRALAGQGSAFAALLDQYPETKRVLDTFKDTPSAQVGPGVTQESP